MVSKRLVGIKDMADYLDISKATLYNWTFQKKIPYIKIGRLVKFDLQDINKWLKDKRVKEGMNARVLTT